MKYVGMQFPLKTKIGVIPFNSEDNFFRFLGNDIIDQPQNDNRYSDLFRIRDNQVAKVFFPCNESLRHIDTLISVINDRYRINNEYYVLPTSLLLLKGRIVGYTMPYIRGQSLQEKMLQQLDLMLM